MLAYFPKKTDNFYFTFLQDPTGIFSLDKTIGLGTYGRIYLGLHEKTGAFTAVKVMNARKTPLPEIGRRVRVNKYQKSVGWRYSVSTQSPHYFQVAFPLIFNFKLIPLCCIVIIRRPPLKSSCLDVITYLYFLTYSHRFNHHIWTLPWEDEVNSTSWLSVLKLRCPNSQCRCSFLMTAYCLLLEISLEIMYFTMVIPFVTYLPFMNVQIWHMLFCLFISVPQQPLSEQAQKPIDVRQRSSQNPQNCPAASESSSEEEIPVTGRRSQSSPPYSTIDQKLLVDIHVPDGFKVGKISPPVYLTNEWVGYNALSEIFRNDWLTPAPVIQPPEEDGDYVELYDAGADTDGDDDDSNDAYEDTYDHENGNDDLDNQVDQANDVSERHDDDDNDAAVDDKENNHDDTPSWPRPSYVRDGSCKQDDRDGSDGGEGTCSSYGIQRASRSHGGSAASWCSAATGDREGHGANIDSGRRGKEGSGGEGASGTNEESGALELNGEENCSETDGPGLERPASQDFEHQQEVMHYLKRMSSSPCDCVSSCDMSHFQPFQIYFKLLSKRVNLLLGTRSNLYLMDRSGKADVTKLIKRRPFRQIQVVEPLNLLITISGRKNRLRVYHLTWLRNKILNDDPESKRRQEEMLKTEEACKAIDKLTGCEHFSVLQHEETTYIAIALKSSIHLYAWAPKSFDESTAIKYALINQQTPKETTCPMKPIYEYWQKYRQLIQRTGLRDQMSSFIC
uniref:non-specific serine/threonine protein kinase n=1 Tax=Equus asinus TaxID=9793 RepID=A0A9L0JJ26_EQUAS